MSALRRLRRRLVPQHLGGRLSSSSYCCRGMMSISFLTIVVGLDAFGLGVEVGDDAVPQHRQRDLRMSSVLT